MLAARGKPGEPGSWLMTYGDLMTLVVTFFVVLTAMSQVQNEERLQETLAAFHQQFRAPAAEAAGAGGFLPRDPALAQLLHQARRRRAALFAAARQAQRTAETAAPLVGSVPAPIAQVDLAAPFDRFSPAQQLDLRRTLSAADERLDRAIEIRGQAVGPANAADRLDAVVAGCRACRDQLVAQGVNPGRIRILLLPEAALPAEPPAAKVAAEAEWTVRLELYLRED